MKRHTGAVVSRKSASGHSPHFAYRGRGLHQFRPESLQQTLGSQGAPPTERRTGRSHSLLAVAVVAFAEGLRAQPSPQSITYIMRSNLCLSLLRKDQGQGPGTEVQHARTFKHETATFRRPVLMLVAIFLKLYVADIPG